MGSCLSNSCVNHQEEMVHQSLKEEKPQETQERNSNMTPMNETVDDSESKEYDQDENEIEVENEGKNEKKEDEKVDLVLLNGLTKQIGGCIKRRGRLKKSKKKIKHYKKKKENGEYLHLNQLQMIDNEGKIEQELDLLGQRLSELRQQQYKELGKLSVEQREKYQPKKKKKNRDKPEIKEEEEKGKELRV